MVQAYSSPSQHGHTAFETVGLPAPRSEHTTNEVDSEVIRSMGGYLLDEGDFSD